MFTILSQHVDTYKETIYPKNQDLHDYKVIFDQLLEQKKRAQNIRDDYNNNRYVNYDVDGHTFQVLAQSVTGYKVALRNADFSLFLTYFEKKSHNPIIKIEYRAEYLVRCGVEYCSREVQRFVIQSLKIEKFDIQAQEIHLACDVQGYRFNFLDKFRFKTRQTSSKIYDDQENELQKNATYFKALNLGSIYYGQGDQLMRIYNKSVQIKTHYEASFIENVWRLNNNYDPNKDVWRIEFQIRRKRIKEFFSQYGTLTDSSNCIASIPDLWTYMIDFYGFKDVSRDNTIYIITGEKTKKDGTVKLLTKYAYRKILSRADVHPLWSHIRHYRGHVGKKIERFKPLAKTNIRYVNNAVTSVFTQMVKNFGRIDDILLKNAFINADNEKIKKFGYGLIDHAVKKSIDHFVKVENMKQFHGLVPQASHDVLGRHLQYYIKRSSLDIFDNASSYFEKERFINE